jgi:very-short-patch-repair endonuclease
LREKYHRIPPRQTKRVRRLRRDATFPESLLWSCLRGGRAAGMKFRRQAAIGEFIVDFYCASVGLVIELDGLSHETQRT